MKKEEGDIQRDLRFARVTEKDIDYFKTILGDLNVHIEEEEIKTYYVDFTKKYRGQAPSVVLTPNSTEQISKIMKYCNQHRLAVVPQGGNTGLVGGSVPVFDEIVLCTKKLNKVLDFDPL